MIPFIIRRILLTIPTLFIISVVSFIIIQIPPGDFVTATLAELEEQLGRNDFLQRRVMALQEIVDAGEYKRHSSWQHAALIGDARQ